MRTSPTGRSSTSGVLPISWRRFDATTASAMPLPHVHRWAQLPDQLVDAPQLAAAHSVDGGRTLRRNESVFAAMQARKHEERRRGIPSAVLDHPFAPFARESVNRNLLESCVARRRLDVRSLEALRDERGRGHEQTFSSGSSHSVASVTYVSMR